MIWRPRAAIFVIVVLFSGPFSARAVDDSEVEITIGTNGEVSSLTIHSSDKRFEYQDPQGLFSLLLISQKVTLEARFEAYKVEDRESEIAASSVPGWASVRGHYLKLMRMRPLPEFLKSKRPPRQSELIEWAHTVLLKDPSLLRETRIRVVKNDKILREISVKPLAASPQHPFAEIMRQLPLDWPVRFSARTLDRFNVRILTVDPSRKDASSK